MPLSGTFDTMQLTDLLQWIQTLGKTGTLTISIDQGDMYLTFQDGNLLAFGSDDPLRQDFGQVLLSRGLVTNDQLRQAAEKSQRGALLIDALKSIAGLDDSLLEQVLKDFVYNSVLDLFFYEEGSFHFSHSGSLGELLTPQDKNQMSFLKTPILTRVILFEGMKRLDEWSQIREVFPNSYVVVHALDGDSENPVWKELRNVGRPISVGELCLQIPGTRFEIYKKLFKAYNLALVGVDLMPVQSAGFTHLGPIDTLIENAKVLMAEKQFDEAREILATATNLDPDKLVARSLLRQVREQQMAYLYQQIPPHRVPISTVPIEKLGEFQLNPRETYLAARLNGKWDVATIIVSTPLGELETLRMLRKFLHAGIVKFDEGLVPG